MDLEILVEVALGLIPPTLMAIFVYALMRSIFRADAKERRVYSKMEAEMRAQRAAELAQKETKNTKK